jgi:hypothetical protein
MLAGLVTYCVGTALWNTLLQERCKDRSDGKARKKTKQPLNDLEEKRRYWILKEEALDRTQENSLWKRLWTCRKTDNRMSE